MVDGNYQIRIDGNEVTNEQGLAMDIDGDGLLGGMLTFGDEEPQAFYRLLGDSDGSRTVNVFDLLGLRQTFALMTGDASFDETFDFNLDGMINVFDLLRFRQNFLKSLPFE